MSTHFGSSLLANNKISIAFPFREDAIMVDFEVDLANKVTHVSIGRAYNRRVEVSEIAEYGKLLMAIGEYVPTLEAELHANQR